eukprot:1156328-Pelagomonas_calceolata.AAC.2
MEAGQGLCVRVGSCWLAENGLLACKNRLAVQQKWKQGRAFQGGQEAVGLQKWRAGLQKVEARQGLCIRVGSCWLAKKRLAGLPKK